MDMYKVQAEEGGKFLVCKNWNDVREYIGDSPILITLVDMTEKEYDSLEEFTGF